MGHFKDEVRSVVIGKTSLSCHECMPLPLKHHMSFTVLCVNGHMTFTSSRVASHEMGDLLFTCV